MARKSRTNRVCHGGVIALLAMAILGAPPTDAAGDDPANIRIVQASCESDNSGRVYPSIQAALASIRDAGPANRYLVRVMPGTYSSSADSPIVLKPFVDIEGGGEGNTIVSASIPLDVPVIYYPILVGDLLPSAATVAILPPDPLPGGPGPIIRISNLQIRNTSARGGIALLVRAPRVIVENVTAEASGTGDNVLHMDYVAIAVTGPEARDVVLRRVTAAAKKPNVGDGATRGIHLANGSSTEVLDSRAVASGGNWARGIATSGIGPVAAIRDCFAEGGDARDEASGINGAGTGTGFLTVERTTAIGHDSGRVQGINAYATPLLIRDSVAEARNGRTEAAGIIVSDNVMVSGSKISARSAPMCRAIDGLNGGPTVLRSEARAEGCPEEMVGIANVGKAADTLIEGGYSNVREVVRCRDASSNPIH